MSAFCANHGMMSARRASWSEWAFAAAVRSVNPGVRLSGLGASRGAGIATGTRLPRMLKAAWLAGAASADGDKGTMGLSVYPPADVRWGNGPASLPAGAKLAVLEGDPRKEGSFVMRLKLPDGYRIPPHTHPKTERVTVIAGTFNIGMGDKFDKKAGKAMPAGTYGHWAAGMKHFVWAKGETILQFHGMGPWSIQYVNPDDDPRKQKE